MNLFLELFRQQIREADVPFDKERFICKPVDVCEHPRLSTSDSETPPSRALSSYVSPETAVKAKSEKTHAAAPLCAVHPLQVQAKRSWEK